MAYVVDILLLLVFAGMVLVGVVKGFVKSVLGMVAIMAAFLLAYQLSPVLAPAVYDTFLSEKVYETIETKLAEAPGATQAAGQVSAVLASIPDYVKSVAASIGIDTAGITDKVNSLDNSNAAVARELADNVAKPVITAVTQAILFVLLLVVSYILLMIVVKLIDKFFKLPVLKTANKILGGALGAVKGIMLVFLLCVIFEIFFGTGNDSFMSGAVESSKIIEFVRGNNFVADRFSA